MNNAIYSDNTTSTSGNNNRFTNTSTNYNPHPVIFEDSISMKINTKLSSMDRDGKIEMRNNNIHIQPINNGFIITVKSYEDGITVHAFSDFSEIIIFLETLGMMDIDSALVIDNV